MNVSAMFNIFKPKIDNKHITILVIDDSMVDQKVACAAVERGGYSIILAGDGQSGIAKATEHKPDLIILDYNLPDAIGPQICETLKKNQTTANIPVLFLTSMDTPDSIISCYEKGGENYLAKPISPKTLLKQIEQTLKDSKTEN
jgi:CheY-like chemotaxis protein